MIIALQIVLCLGTVVAQATLSTWLSVNNIYPDLCLILACIVGFLTNEYKGLMIGLTIGLFQDLLAPGGIGLNMILKGLAGFLAGVTTHTVSSVTTRAANRSAAATTWTPRRALWAASWTILSWACPSSSSIFDRRRWTWSIARAD